MNDYGQPARIAASAPLLPVVIDLDGILLKTNSRDETFIHTLRTNPSALWQLPLKLIIRRAAVKAFLAKHLCLEVDDWPVREDFLAFVKNHADAGHHVVLATAAHRSIAEAIKGRFPFVAEVIAMEDANNSNGKTKAQKLWERFPEGFIYAGGSAADLEVWRSGADCVLVGAARSVARRANKLGKPLAVFPRETKWRFTVMRRSLRLHQWIKNTLIFVPLVLGEKVFDPVAWEKAVIGFLAFCAAASATYIINDLWDLSSDRKHWSKHTRPLAAGDLTIRFGLLLAIGGLIAAFVLAGTVGAIAVGWLGVYVALTLVYSFQLKRVPLLDLFVLASLFTLRLGFGIVITEVRISPWLLVFSMLVFLSLSAAKRHNELTCMTEKSRGLVPGRAYLIADAPLLLGTGIGTSLGAVLIMTLYLIEREYPQGLYASPAYLWAIPSMLFLFLGRIWLLCQRGRLYHDDPVAFALKDRTSLALGVLIIAALAAARLL